MWLTGHYNPITTATTPTTEVTVNFKTLHNDTANLTAKPVNGLIMNNANFTAIPGNGFIVNLNIIHGHDSTEYRI